MIDEAEIPTSRVERERWLDRRANDIAKATRRKLRSLLTSRFDEFVRDSGALVAAGDLSIFDSIPNAWLSIVTDSIVPTLTETYLTGAVTAWLGQPVQPRLPFAARWEAVTNEAAVSYAQQATNRLAGVGDSTWHAIRARASNAVATGLTNEQLKGEIENVAKMSEYRADTIARTETIGAYVNGDMAGARALGEHGPVEKVWRATLDRRTREDHWEADGQCVKLDETFDVGGEQLDAPHDPNADAGNVVNCRCYVEMLYAGDERPDGSIVEESDDGVPDELTIEDEPIDEPASATADGPVTEREALSWYRNEAQAAVADQDLADPAWRARSDYIGGSHNAINDALRSGNVDAAMFNRVREVDVAVEQLAVPVPSNVPLFRGARYVGDLTPGEVISEPAFMSTSPVESVAKGFAGYGDDAVLYRIEHAGTAAMPASTLEAELVLPRGASMQVTGVEANPLGGRIVHVRLV